MMRPTQTRKWISTINERKSTRNTIIQLIPKGVISNVPCLRSINSSIEWFDFHFLNFIAHALCVSTEQTKCLFVTNINI